MTVSLRRPLIAGTVAAVSAGAVAVMPAGHPERLAQAFATSTSQVSLAAWTNPVDQLLGSLELGQNYLFGAYFAGGDAPTPGAGVANWPFAGFSETGGDLLNYLLSTQTALGNYSYVGTLPNNTANAAPISQQLQINWFDYINIGLSGLIGAGAAIATGVWEYPAELIAAAELALSGNIEAALGVLVAAVVVPATAAAASLAGAGIYIAENVIARLGAVIEGLPQILTSFVGTAVGGATIVATQSIDLATTWLANLASLDFEGAWDTAIKGLLGPSGLPGTVLNLLTGAGIQTGPITTPEDIPGNFVPSLRTSLLGALWTTATALSTSAPLSAEARSSPTPFLRSPSAPPSSDSCDASAVRAEVAAALKRKPSSRRPPSRRPPPRRWRWPARAPLSPRLRAVPLRAERRRPVRRPTPATPRRATPPPRRPPRQAAAPRRRAARMRRPRSGRSRARGPSAPLRRADRGVRRVG